jgi:hypothetical protein
LAEPGGHREGKRRAPVTGTVTGERPLKNRRHAATGRTPTQTRSRACRHPVDCIAHGPSRGVIKVEPFGLSIGPPFPEVNPESSASQASPSATTVRLVRGSSALRTRTATGPPSRRASASLNVFNDLHRACDPMIRRVRISRPHPNLGFARRYGSNLVSVRRAARPRALDHPDWMTPAHPPGNEPPGTRSQPRGAEHGNRRSDNRDREKSADRRTR